MQTLMTYYDVGAIRRTVSAKATTDTNAPKFFTEDRTMSVAEFMADKRPDDDVDAVACLAYYIRATTESNRHLLWAI